MAILRDAYYMRERERACSVEERGGHSARRTDEERGESEEAEREREEKKKKRGREA